MASISVSILKFLTTEVFHAVTLVKFNWKFCNKILLCSFVSLSYNCNCTYTNKITIKFSNSLYVCNNLAATIALFRITTSKIVSQPFLVFLKIFSFPQTQTKLRKGTYMYLMSKVDGKLFQTDFFVCILYVFWDYVSGCLIDLWGKTFIRLGIIDGILQLLVSCNHPVASKTILFHLKFFPFIF